jgi:hypothetical protein
MPSHPPTEPIAIELEQPNRPDQGPLDKERAPEYAPCLACGRRHSREGDHIACLNRHLLEAKEHIKMLPDFRVWLAAKDGIRLAKALPASSGGLVMARRQGRGA